MGRRKEGSGKKTLTLINNRINSSFPVKRCHHKMLIFQPEKTFWGGEIKWRKMFVCCDEDEEENATIAPILMVLAQNEKESRCSGSHFLFPLKSNSK